MALKGRRAIVTGSTGGVGTAVVRRFIAEGVNVIGTVHQKEESGREKAPNVTYMTADVTREDDVRRLFAEAGKLAGGIDILVNGVGGFLPSRSVAELSVEEWDSMFRINLQSVFLCTREALRIMQGRPYGRIISFSAMPAFRPVAGKAPYAIAKYGVSLFTEIVARELKGSGVTINAIAPGIIATESNKSAMPEEDFSAWVTPEGIAETICSLCHEESVVNGTTLRAFGGL